MKIGDYVSGQQPGGWLVEGRITAIEGAGDLLEFAQVTVSLDPAKYPTVVGSDNQARISEQWITKLNGERYNPFETRNFTFGDLIDTPLKHMVCRPTYNRL